MAVWVRSGCCRTARGREESADWTWSGERGATGDEVKLDGVEHIILSESDILAVVERG
jgi:hypothetical protein